MKIYYERDYFEEDDEYIDYYYFTLENRTINVLCIELKEGKFKDISLRYMSFYKYLTLIDIFEFVFSKKLFEKCFNEEIEDQIKTLEILQIYKKIKK